MEITVSEWADWKRNPVTRELLNLLSKYRMGKLEEIAHGHAEGLEQIYVEIGRAQGVEDALHYLATDAREDLIDDRKQD